ncbi:diaminopimelate decarboxylase [Mesorhizobium soli]|uniref:diaminopimelate decarboxylase n=1 Tax=Pseudaminobacter soli (ex Li et al. 2025) TaxID=1295366 RepID=UPI0024763F9D|nr:diaminopimelate decarboxylase [Mesorhizobium soli]MDH6232275.1 diaminopimelate decarboxylase [Mesorhizobium soli]
MTKYAETASRQGNDREWLAYRSGDLHVEDVPLSDVATAVQTPFYCYSADAIRSAYQCLAAALSPSEVSICFAVKANGNIAVLRLLSELGCGMDIVSGGELERALAAGVPASKIIFSGVGKTRAEIARALDVGIHQINVESAAEVAVVAEIARALGKRAPVALRVNPDVDAKTHAKITTATKESKFGIPIGDVADLYAEVAAMPELEALGIAVHIGSQIHDMAPYRRAFSAMADLVTSMRGRGLVVPRLDLGGGIGIASDDTVGPDIAEYAKIIAETVGYLGCELTVEPGRWLVGRAGLLVTELLYLKDIAGGTMGILDVGMNDLMRPALYDAHHPVLPLHEPRTAVAVPAYSLVGPICESSDKFGSYEGLGELRAGDLLAFDCAGAYGASMASTYNSRDLVAEVLVEGSLFRTIRRRQDIGEMLKLEQAGAWQVPARAGQGMAERASDGAVCTPMTVGAR